jgi:hypothetical protein
LLRRSGDFRSARRSRSPLGAERPALVYDDIADMTDMYPIDEHGRLVDR